MVKINPSINSMSLVKHIQAILKSSYTSLQISKSGHIDVQLIHKLRHRSIDISQLRLSSCWKLERFYDRHFVYGIARNETDAASWNGTLKKHILNLLHKICLCAWSMPSDRQIWVDFKKLANGYKKYYNYGMNKHPKVATVGYVKHILKLPYHYAVKRPYHFFMTILATKNHSAKKIPIKSWNIRDYKRFQPEVIQLGMNRFDITTPYENGFGTHLHLELAFKHGSWWLLSDLDPDFLMKDYQSCQKLSISRRKYLQKCIKQMCTDYQINYAKHRIFFIEILDYSLQSACYRMIHFELIRLALIKFLNIF